MIAGLVTQTRLYVGSRVMEISVFLVPEHMAVSTSRERFSTGSHAVELWLIMV
ncbi:hypothetical protein EXIGLDRAFT_737219 [Exidia glandulosa HHB12029]|uniref:Uncharacterized protein n=1 Tax=Exidia glandulosa HHB12029 TaxID=1314781 RepID=A0A166MZQ7_EXIGL|nr:hypothetical protein EXIGLDRAFT_737219 [Exidia glandulosa HHB12029]